MKRIFRILLTQNGWRYLFKLIGKSIKITFTQGPFALIREINNFYNKKRVRLYSNIEVTIDPVLDQPVLVRTISQMIEDRFVGLKPLHTLYVLDDSLRINFLIPSLGESSLFGGAATGLIFATLLANSLNCPLRIITTDASCDLSVYFQFLELFNLEKPVNVFVYDASWRFNSEEGPKIEVSKKDIFISTIWWSSYIARFANLRKKFIYLIQEYEPVFYQNGDDRLATLESYSRFTNFLPVLNTSNLYNFFKDNGFEHIAQNGVSFEPSFPHFFYKPGKDSFKKKKKYNFFFYSRPNTPRNLFYRGLEILDEAIRTKVLDPEKWNIYFAGESIADIQFCDGTKPIILGKLTYKEYSQFISTIDAGLSLMEAPHPSYPPLDMVSAGAVILTNNSRGKANLDYCNNLIFSDIATDKMVKKLEFVLNLAQDFEKRKANYESSNLYRDWNNSFDPVIDKIKSQIKSGEL